MKTRLKRWMAVTLLGLCTAHAEDLKTLDAIIGADVDTATDYLPMIDTSADGLKNLTIDEMWKALGGTNVSPTELGYLDGVTSGVQTQIDALDAADTTLQGNIDTEEAARVAGDLPAQTLANLADDPAASREILNITKGNGRTAILFVCAGQSNMDGADELAAYEDQDKPLQNMFQMSRGFSTNYAVGDKWKFIPAWQPLQRFIAANTNLRNSPGFYLARAFALANPGVDVYILPASYSGTSFNGSNWNPGDSLYEQMAAETLHCLRELRKSYHFVEHGGLLWQQGESDADNDTEANAYQALLLAMIADYRTVCGEDVPVVIGTMHAPSVGTTAEQTVDAVHRNIGNLITNATFSDNDALTDTASDRHFTAEDLRTVGANYYTAWKTLRRARKHTPNVVAEISTDGSTNVNLTPSDATVSGTPIVSGGTIVFTRSPYYRLGKRVLPIGEYTCIFIGRLLNPNYAANRGPNDVLFGRYSASGQTYGLQYIAQIPTVRAYHIPDADNGSVLLNTSVAPSFGQWKAYALTWDGRKMEIWEDGVVVASDTPTNKYLDTTTGTMIDVGSSVNNSTKLEAEMRLARIYDGVLTSAEMLALLEAWKPDQTIDLASGLQADWQFADLTDSSGNGYTLTVVGTAPGLSAGVATFAANGHYTTTLVEPASYTRLVKFRTSYAGNATLMCAADNLLTMQLVTGGGGLLTSSNALKTVAALNDGEWHTAALVYDSTRKTFELWIDGAMGQAITNYTSPGAGAPYAIGSSTAAGGVRYSGEIDRVRVWNRALKPAEIIAAAAE